MSLIFWFTSVAFFMWTVRNSLFWTYLWQLKEYRFDRVFVHLKETYQGKQILFSYISIAKLILIFFYPLVVYNRLLLAPYQWCIFLIFTAEAFFVIKEGINHVLRRPVFTIKAALLILLTLFIITALFMISPLDRFLWLLLLDRSIAFIIVFFVFLFSFPTTLMRDFEIEKASKKLIHRKNIKVIGVSGSYGKSSTKEYIAQILQRKFRILKTQGTNNTAIGIAATILQGLKSDTQIFVVEMGAYKKGEIAQICSMVRPKIGVLTAINNQHLSLFGSLENTIAAKYELIESLPRGGLALFNGNNEYTQKLYKNDQSIYIKGIAHTKKKKILYQCFEKKINQKAEIAAYNIIPKKDSVNFDVWLQGRIIPMKSPLTGAHVVENILPGVYIASELGMTDSEIQKAVRQLSPLPKTMIRHILHNNACIIDDTFSSTPQAVLAALQYMTLYKGKRILVFQPMIELGKDGENEHYELAREIGKVCEVLFLTNKNFYSAVLRGIYRSGKNCKAQIASPNFIYKFLQENIGKEDIVTFENRGASASLNKVLINL